MYASKPTILVVITQIELAHPTRDGDLIGLPIPQTAIGQEFCNACLRTGSLKAGLLKDIYCQYPRLEKLYWH